MMKFAFFPGCAAKAVAGEANKALRAVANHLQLELVEFENFSCCGAGVLHEERPNLSVAINARNFAIAEREGLPILAICNTCQLTMVRSKKILDENEVLRTRVNHQLAQFDLEYKGEVRVRHLLDVLTNDLGLDDLQAKFSRQLDGLKIAPFYGCHMLRPQELVDPNGDRDPEALEKLIASVGATAVTYDSKGDCCGFHVMLVNPEVSVGRVRNTMIDARESGADMVVTPCSLCQITLDTYQYKAEQSSERAIDMPVIHLPQLVGLALGLDRESLGLSSHLVPLPEELNIG